MFIKYIDNKTNQCLVDTIFPNTNGIPQEIIDKCIEVNSMPEPQSIDGKQAIMYCDPVGKTVFYGYEDIMVQVSQVDLNNVQNQIANMQEAINIALGL